MSLRFFGRCVFAGWIVLSLIAAAFSFSQSTSAGPAISANELVTWYVQQSLTNSTLKPEVTIAGCTL